MDLINEHGQKIKNEKPKVLDASGSEVVTNLSTKDIGKKLAQHLLDGANAKTNNEDVNKQFEILYFAALNLLGHRVVNVGLGFNDETKTITEWDFKAAINEDLKIGEDLSKTVGEWRDAYFNGELTFKRRKK